MKKLVMTIVIIALVAIITVPSTAQMRIRGGYGRGHYHPADITKMPHLDLTDEQITKLKKLYNAHLLDIKPLEDQMYRKTLDLKVLWLEQTPDMNKMALVQREIQSLRQGMYEKVVVYRDGIRNVLTSQQQKILLSNRDKRSCGFGRDMGARE